MVDTDGPRLQFRVQYHQEEDRILLSGAFPNGSSMALWLTRHLAFGFIDIAGRVARDTAAAADPDTQAQIADFDREAASRSVDRESGYAGGRNTLGPDPVLINRIGLTPRDNGEVTVVFGLTDKRDLSFSLPRKTFLALWDLLEELVRTKTPWLTMPDFAEVALSGSAGESPKVLH